MDHTCNAGDDVPRVQMPPMPMGIQQVEQPVKLQEDLGEHFKSLHLEIPPPEPHIELHPPPEYQPYNHSNQTPLNFASLQPPPFPSPAAYPYPNPHAYHPGHPTPSSAHPGFHQERPPLSALPQANATRSFSYPPHTSHPKTAHPTTHRPATPKSATFKPKPTLTTLLPPPRPLAILHSEHAYLQTTIASLNARSTRLLTGAASILASTPDPATARTPSEGRRLRRLRHNAENMRKRAEQAAQQERWAWGRLADLWAEVSARRRRVGVLGGVLGELEGGAEMGLRLGGMEMWGTPGTGGFQGYGMGVGIGVESPMWCDSSVSSVPPTPAWSDAYTVVSGDEGCGASTAGAEAVGMSEAGVQGPFPGNACYDIGGQAGTGSADAGYNKENGSLGNECVPRLERRMSLPPPKSAWPGSNTAS